ncbi:MAG: stage V sporulation protein AC [Clostridiales bacterium]|nr:stage V sporulation protein AC [Clostridiales bacterium]
MISNSEKERYKNIVDKASPKSNVLSDCLKAFWVGGSICVMGQLISNYLKSLGLDKGTASLYTSSAIILLTVILTSFGFFEQIAKYAGAGTSVPITGFANSVCASALEFKKEGIVLGMAAKMFVLAGPVIVYSTVSSVIVGVIYYIYKYTSFAK